MCGSDPYYVHTKMLFGVHHTFRASAIPAQCMGNTMPIPPYALHAVFYFIFYVHHTFGGCIQARGIQPLPEQWSGQQRTGQCKYLKDIHIRTVGALCSLYRLIS